MGGIFNYDNLVMTWIRKILNMVLVSFLWFLGCIPIFTIGASCSALYYSIQKNLKYDRGYAASEFWKGFKASFKQATLVWLLPMLFFLLTLFGFIIYAWGAEMGLSNLVAVSGGSKVLSIIGCCLFLMYCAYLFPYVARFNLPTKKLISNCFILMIRHLLSSLLCLFFIALGAFLIWLLPALVLIVPALVSWQISLIMEKLYRKYMTPEELAADEERNRTQF